MHVPEPLQWSVCVQATPSLHWAVMPRLLYTHPVAMLQLSAVHVMPSLQTRAVPGRQEPDPLQVSLTVQALPSLHVEPGAMFDQA